MNTTTKLTCITKLIVAKPFTYNKGFADERTIRAGTVLETKKRREGFYRPWEHKIVMGYGLCQVIPLEYVKVKWFTEKRTVTVEREEIEVR